MVVHWTDEADVKLFIAVLKIHAVKLNYEALAAAMGPDVTPKAITQHIAKLRAKAAAAGEDDSAPGKTAAKAGGAATKKRGRGAVVGGRVKKVTGKKQKRKREGDEECELGGGEQCDDEENLEDLVRDGDGGGKMDGEDGLGFEDDGVEGKVPKVKEEEGSA